MCLKSAGEYEYADPSECDYLTTDADGFCKSKDLPYGTYTVIQLSGAPGTELMPAFDVYVSEDGECYKYLINNAAFESYLKIVKTDAESGDIIRITAYPLCFSSYTDAAGNKVPALRFAAFEVSMV